MIEVFLISVFAHKYDFELLGFSLWIEFSVLLAEQVFLESTAAWSPMCTKVESYALYTAGQCLSKRHFLLFTVLTSRGHGIDEFVSQDFFHLIFSG